MVQCMMYGLRNIVILYTGDLDNTFVSNKRVYNSDINFF